MSEGKIILAERERNHHEVLRVEYGDYKGVPVTSLRYWYRGRDGNFYPGRQGITIPIRLLDTAIIGLLKADDMFANLARTPPVNHPAKADIKPLRASVEPQQRDAEIQNLNIQGFSAAEIARQLGIGRATVYRRLKVLSQAGVSGETGAETRSAAIGTSEAN
jgi:DNA-binding NtrC family response regulator